MDVRLRPARPPTRNSSARCRLLLHRVAWPVVVDDGGVEHLLYCALVVVPVSAKRIPCFGRQVAIEGRSCTLVLAVDETVSAQMWKGRRRLNPTVCRWAPGVALAGRRVQSARDCFRGPLLTLFRPRSAAWSSPLIAAFLTADLPNRVFALTWVRIGVA